MVRFAASILLVVAFAIQAFHQGGIVVSYYMNAGAYAKNCVNKAKPVLKCNGKCQMAKKILEAQKKQEQAQEQKFETNFQVICFRSDFFSFSVYNSTTSNSYSFYLVKPELPVQAGSVFHPPCLV